MQCTWPSVHERSLSQAHTSILLFLMCCCLQVEVEGKMLRTLYGTESLTMLMSTPGLIRNVALAGHLHHGKTLVRTLRQPVPNSL